MARPVRIEYPGAYYYLSSKGFETIPIFKEAKDRQEFLTILQHVTQRMKWRIYAYNLLDDSYQLFINTSHANLSRGMRQLNGIYTQRYNTKYISKGQIFHGRFKAVLVEAEHASQAVILHTLSIPLQKKKVRQLEQWKWNNYQALMGIVDSPTWLNNNESLAFFAKQKKRARKSLALNLLNYDKDFDLMTQVQGQILLGSEKFVNKWKKQLASGKVMDKAMQRKAKPVKSLTAYSKNYKQPKKAMINAYKTGNYTLEQIGKHFSVHYSTVSRLIKKSESM